MDDYYLVLLFSFFVLIPLLGWKVTGIDKKLKNISRRGNDEKQELSNKQKEFIEFLEKASSQSKE